MTDMVASVAQLADVVPPVPVPVAPPVLELLPPVPVLPPLLLELPPLLELLPPLPVLPPLLLELPPLLELLPPLPVFPPLLLELPPVPTLPPVLLLSPPVPLSPLPPLPLLPPLPPFGTDSPPAQEGVIVAASTGMSAVTRNVNAFFMGENPSDQEERKNVGESQTLAHLPVP